jgi:hypothetical protein
MRGMDGHRREPGAARNLFSLASSGSFASKYMSNMGPGASDYRRSELPIAEPVLSLRSEKLSRWFIAANRQGSAPGVARGPRSKQRPAWRESHASCWLELPEIASASGELASP